MKAKIGLIIGGIIIVVFGTVVIRSCSKNAIKSMNEDLKKESFDETQEEMKKDLGYVLDCSERNLDNVVNGLIGDSKYYWNDKFISDNFYEKYKSAKDICPDSYNWTSVGAGKSKLKEKNVVSINGMSKSYYSDEYGCDIQQTTACFYDYIINEKNQLDDLIFISKKVYPEIISITGERLDGKKEAKPDRVSELLHYIANPYHDFDFYSTKNYSEEAMPYSDICKIINRPNLDKLGIPDNSYDEKRGDDTYIIFEYPDWTVTWKVNYKVNDDLFFDYIEYIEANE